MVRIKGRELLKIYECNDWIVEVWQVNEDFEAWIQHKDYGVKSLMFGMPIKQQSIEGFKKCVECQMVEYALIYTDEYMD